MKVTLLEIVQEILSSMDSDEVNSIMDTVESMQVAQVVKSCYNDIISQVDFDDHFETFTLDSLGDLFLPVAMLVPQNIHDVLWIKYQINEDGDDVEYQDVTYLDWDTFFTMQQGLDTEADNVAVLNEGAGRMLLPYLTDKPPGYWTWADDNKIVFDSYDSDQSSTLMSSRTLCYGTKDVTFILEDSFIPDLQADQFSLLRNAAKAHCFAELKQTQHARAERNERRGWLTLQRKRWERRPGSALDDLPNYGKR